MTLPLVSTSTSGGAYAIAARPRSFFGVVSPLTNTLRYNVATSFSGYNSNSPDGFTVATGFDPAAIDPPNGDSVNETIEPPNAARKAVWELKFDTVWATAGTFELDSSNACCQPIGFVTIEPLDVNVNFLKSTITVPSPPKGDLNWDLALTTADVVLILNCVFCSDCPSPPAGTAACDLNCEGMLTPADVVLELYAVFLGRHFPCTG